MIPKGGTLTTINIQEIQQPSRTYRLDRVNKRVIGMIDGLEAVKQAVFKILSTFRFKYLIYSWNYGTDEISAGMSPLYFQSELSRCIREALLQDDRITAIEDMHVTVEGDSALAEFTVVSIYGHFTVSKEVRSSV